MKISAIVRPNKQVKPVKKRGTAIPVRHYSGYLLPIIGSSFKLV